MLFVDMKTEAQLDMQTLHRSRDRLIGECTALILEHVLAELNRRIPKGSVNGRVWPALIRLWGLTMPEAYSTDIRKRVIARVEGGASRREATELFDISPSAAVKWVKCFHETGSCVASRAVGAHRRWRNTRDGCSR
jgi:hypothetical protein